jgi:hypothetical protein
LDRHSTRNNPVEPKLNSRLVDMLDP